MDSNKIEQLLEKYWDCRTTVEEEKELKAFFSSANVPEKWNGIAPLFQYYAEEKKKDHLDELFDEQVLNQIQALDNKKVKKGRVVQLFYDMAKVAAVVVVLITATYFVREEYIDNNSRIDPYLADTFQDPKVAFEETKKALMLISKNINMGREEVQKVGVFSDAQEKIKETDKN